MTKEDQEESGRVDDPVAAAHLGALINALIRLLRPLVRALVQQQVQYPQLAQLIKSLYIEVAHRDFSLGEKAMTLSRLSLLTGIHRREAKRLIEDSAISKAPAPASVSLGAQILAVWTGEPRWLDPAGRPRALPRTENDGEGFQSLVRSVSVDLHPRSILDEWLRLGVAELDSEDRVVLRAAAFVPRHGFVEKAHYVGRNLRDHVSAGFENLGAESPSHFERAVYYADLPEGAVEELDRLARDLGQQTLERVNARARELKQAAAAENSDSGHRRFTFGVYVYDAAAADEEDEEGGDSA